MEIIKFLKRIFTTNLNKSEKKIDKKYFFGDYKVILKEEISTIISSI